MRSKLATRGTGGSFRKCCLAPFFGSTFPTCVKVVVYSDNFHMLRIIQAWQSEHVHGECINIE